MINRGNVLPITLRERCAGDAGPALGFLQHPAAAFELGGAEAGAGLSEPLAAGAAASLRSCYAPPA